MSWFDKMLGRRTQGSDEQGYESFDTLASTRVAPAKESRLPTFRHPVRPWTLSQSKFSAENARGMLRDAFSPSQPVTDREMFAGRRELIESLIGAIEDQKLHFVLYGDRGIGKTSILRLLSGLAEDAGYLVCYVSCGESLTFEELARRVAQRIPLLHHRDFAPGSPEIEQGLTLSDILPASSLGVSTFGEYLGRLAETRLIIMMDEFDRVQTDEFRKSIAELIKTLSDSAAPAQVVIAGVASDLTELIAQIPSVRRNVIGVSVPNMSDAEVGEMLDLAQERSSFVFSPEARELLNLASLGLPYVVGLVAQHAAFIASDKGELEVKKADVREAIIKSRADLAGRISARTLRSISDVEQSDNLIDLSKIAHNALRSGGTVPANIVPRKFKQPEHGGLALPVLEAIEGDPLDRWRFVDDGASVYVWLSALCAR